MFIYILVEETKLVNRVELSRESKLKESIETALGNLFALLVFRKFTNDIKLLQFSSDKYLLHFVHCIDTHHNEKIA